MQGRRSVRRTPRTYAASAGEPRASSSVLTERQALIEKRQGLLSGLGGAAAVVKGALGLL